MINNKRMHAIIAESINSVLTEADRHRDGYYDEYARKTGRKDRHSADYYKNYREKKKQEKELNNTKEPSKSTSLKKKKDRREYYRRYNQEHPERLNRGFTKGYVNGNIEDGQIKHKIRTGNHSLSDHLRRKEMEWHDDDWCEDVD